MDSWLKREMCSENSTHLRTCPEAKTLGCCDRKTGVPGQGDPLNFGTLAFWLSELRFEGTSNPPVLMRTVTRILSLLIALNWPVGLNASARDINEAELAGKRLIAEIDQQVAAEQYRHLQMEVFKAQLEMQLTEIKLRHSPGEDRLQRGERELAVQGERLELLRMRLRELREQIVDLHVRRVELQREDLSAMANALDGTWVGQDAEEDARIRLTVKEDQARLEVLSEDEWYELGWKSEPREEGLWELTLLLKGGSELTHIGETCLGLARLDADTLTLAVHEPGNPVRPTSMESGSQAKVLNLKRQ